ncbi:formimidoyltransferase-cyclodeaminase-like isoform X2 [Centruroides sculpturatus]|uniref:formimidoyltransferase-cyclodeaminase-like isoform X2 n=1 Tax=Centruroides sculpturatus TaxID=218467 RepID=UPI000C6DDD30|nr:formimidoyltransferase-cyclodeaminase-like isoform X2 [Centruroides sculpturatus]
MTKQKIVECVPNFSEGQNREVIDKISAAISSVDGISLLDVDPGPSTNRTVYTFVGSPDAVIEGALNAARTAFKLIDMAKHKGEHPRLGALDVCPFIPVQGVEMEECIYCARKFAEKLAAELKVPVYLYGYAAQHEYRKTVPQIRCGEYEGILEKIVKPEWKPDYGPAEFVPQWGATMAGARKFLIAYNVNLLGTKEQAHRIALNIREQGRSKEEPGRLKNCQAIGWWLDESNIAQVSINLTDHETTPIHTAFEEVSSDARELNIAVTGSQIVGLVPLRALLQAAEYYIQKENLFILEEEQKIHLVINRLGLNSLSQFIPKERVIEYMLPDQQSGSLINKTVKDFVCTVAARTPAPGGGSIAGAVAAMAALKLPRTTVEEEAVRDAAMEAGLKKAIAVPMNLARAVSKVWEATKELAVVANIGTKSDLQVGVKCLETGVLGAYWNVTINTEGIKDEKYKNEVLQEIEQHRYLAEKNCNEVLKLLQERKA